MPAHTDTNGTGTQTLTPKPGVWYHRSTLAAALL